MGREGASTAFSQVIQAADLTGHFEARRHRGDRKRKALRLANDAQFQKWQNRTGAGIQRALLRAGTIGHLVLLPAKLPARTDCARDLSKKRGERNGCYFPKEIPVAG